MSKNKKIENIHSLYILDTIFDYIKDTNYKYKLFTYSKSFQKKFKIKLFNYQEIYINKLGIQINNYFCDLQKNNKNNYDKKMLNKNLQEDLIKYNLDINTLQIYILNYYEKYLEKLKEKNNGEKLYSLKLYNNVLIDIYSPFFDFLSKTEIFEHIFTINISVNFIEKYNLKNDYILSFNNLNKTNSKYSSIKFDFKESKDFDYLKDFNINFKQIKKLVINKENYNDNINNDYLLNLLNLPNEGIMVIFIIRIFDNFIKGKKFIFIF